MDDPELKRCIRVFAEFFAQYESAVAQAEQLARVAIWDAEQAEANRALWSEAPRERWARINRCAGI